VGGGGGGGGAGVGAVAVAVAVAVVVGIIVSAVSFLPNEQLMEEKMRQIRLL